jgi:hypothetical protein
MVSSDPELAALMLNSGIVVPSEDSHQSEYIAPCDARRGAYDPPGSTYFVSLS